MYSSWSPNASLFVIVVGFIGMAAGLWGGMTNLLIFSGFLTLFFQKEYYEVKKLTVLMEMRDLSEAIGDKRTSSGI